MQPISPSNVDTPDVPLSYGIKHDNFIFVSGQVAFDLQTGEVVGESIQEQTAKTLENVEAILSEEGASLDDVIKATVFLVDVEDFEGMNKVYAEYMNDPYPARSAFEVSDLAADGLLVEIEVIAVL